MMDALFHLLLFFYDTIHGGYSDLCRTISQWLIELVGQSGAEPWSSFARHSYRILMGLGLTVNLIVFSSLIGLALSIGIALARISRHKLLWMPAYAYIYFLRGTPVLVQVYLIYYGLGQFAFLRGTGAEAAWLWDNVLSSPYWCAIIAFSLNEAAYTAEILRGAIVSLPRGEVEAAQALGLSRVAQFRHIILPRAFRVALPAYSNDFVLLIKSSALASTITLMDLMGATRAVIARTYMNMDFFLLAGVLYLIITAVCIGGFRLLERALSGHRRASAPQRRAAAQAA